MQLGMIGLGKMGGNMAERLRLGGHQVVGFDFSAEAVARLTATGNVGVSTLDDLAKKLTGRKAIWIMVPQGPPVDQTIAKLEPMLKPGDILIDGGNSNYKDSMRRHTEVTAKGFQFVDVGTSGGVWGLKEGYSMMIGGDKEPVDYLRPIFEDAGAGSRQGLGARGAWGRGPLCEDDSQRDRVRHDAGLCGRLYDHGDQEGIRAGPAADLPDLALRQRGAQLAAGFDRGCAGQESNARWARGICRGLRRRPLDGDRGYRPECFRADDYRVADAAHPLARGEQLYRPDAGHYAQ